MQSCIGGSVVDINAAVLADDGSVSERNVGNVADALDAVGRDEQSGGACDEFGRIVEVGSEYVDDVAQASRSIPYAVGNVYPALGGLYRNSAGAVLDLGDSVINSRRDDHLVSLQSAKHTPPPEPVEMKSSCGRV